MLDDEEEWELALELDFETDEEEDTDDAELEELTPVVGTLLLPLDVIEALDEVLGVGTGTFVALSKISVLAKGVHDELAGIRGVYGGFPSPCLQVVVWPAELTY